MIPAVPSTATRSGLHNDVQHGIDQRHPVRQHAAHAAATRGGGHRGAHSARHALGTARALGARGTPREPDLTLGNESLRFRNVSEDVLASEKPPGGLEVAYLRSPKRQVELPGDFPGGWGNQI